MKSPPVDPSRSAGQSLTVFSVAGRNLRWESWTLSTLTGGPLIENDILPAQVH
jgi:hypothetical protein